MSKSSDFQRLLQEAAQVLAQEYCAAYSSGAATTLRGFISNHVARALLIHADSSRRKLDILRLMAVGSAEGPFDPQLPTVVSFSADLFRLFGNVTQPEGFTRVRRAERPRLFTAELLLPRSNLRRLIRWELLAILAESSEDPLVRMTYALQLAEGKEN